MKKLILTLLLIATSFAFAQTKNLDTISEKISFLKKYSEPSFNNTITNHFKKYLNSQLIESANLSQKKKEIWLEFNLDKNNNIININTNAENKRLEKEIIKALKLLSLSDLNIQIKSELYNYAIQIISLEGEKSVLKCSSKVISKRNAIFKGCENEANNYNDLKECNDKVLASFFIQNFDKTLAKRSQLNGAITIYCKFIINKDTKKFSDFIVKAPNDALKYETKRVLYMFPEIIQPVYFMDKPSNGYYSVPLKLYVD